MLDFINFRPRSSSANPQLKKIYIPQSALKDSASPHAASQALTDYVNASLQIALFLVEEIPIKAYWLYAAEYYIGQVVNGGHSLYLSNAKSHPIDAEKIFQMAVKGLDLIGCTLYRDILKEVLAWRAEFPEEADKQNGFTQSADALKEVDSFFFEQDDTAYYHAVRDWLKSSRLVEIMPDEKWHKTLKTLPQKNRRLKSRQRVATIMSLDDKLTNGPLATYQSAIAGLEKDGKVVTIRHMKFTPYKKHPLAKTPDYDFTNPDYMVWDLETSVGPLFGFMHNNEIVICDGVREDGCVNTVHRRSVARINHQLSIAKDQNPARYAYELLRKVAPSEEIALLSFMTIEQSPEQLAHGVMNYGITTHMGSEYAMSLGKTGAMLYTRWGGQSLMSMSSREFEALNAEDLSKLT